MSEHANILMRVPYSTSFPLARWFGLRRETISTLAQAHTQLGEVDGPGRPLEIGRPVAHAYILRVVAEFQAFTRDLHDLAAETMVTLSGANVSSRAILIAGATEGRVIDRGNADIRSLAQDFRRIGIAGLNGRLASRSAHWGQTQNRRGDRALYQDLIGLRNALAHGNQRQLVQLRASGVLDTVSWARARLPGLDRTARALDRIVWDHLHNVFGGTPW
jgi:hypothetical protein